MQNKQCIFESFNKIPICATKYKIMGIIIENKSICPICKLVLNNGKPYHIFPPLITNILDDLYLFSDAGVHMDCLNKSVFKAKLFYHLKIYNRRMLNQAAICAVSGEVISQADLVSFGLLTSNEIDSLYQYSYMTFNRRNISRWPQKEEFIIVAEDFLRRGKWSSACGFNYLEYVLDVIK